MRQGMAGRKTQTNTNRQTNIPSTQHTIKQGGGHTTNRTDKIKRKHLRITKQNERGKKLTLKENKKKEMLVK